MNVVRIHTFVSSHWIDIKYAQNKYRGCSVKMRGSTHIAPETRKMWWMNITLLGTALVTVLSGVYFLLFSGGFRGGRNPWYGVELIFSRATWDNIHTWGGVLMITVATLHLVAHWPWFVRMGRRMISEIRGGCGCMNRYGRLNLALSLALGLLFVLAAVSGIVLLFLPQGREVAITLLWTRRSWDILHTWSGTLMIITAMLHIGIHWKWITKVTRNMVRAMWVRGIPCSSTQQGAFPA